MSLNDVSVPSRYFFVSRMWGPKTFHNNLTNWLWCLEHIGILTQLLPVFSKSIVDNIFSSSDVNLSTKSQRLFTLRIFLMTELPLERHRPFCLEEVSLLRPYKDQVLSEKRIRTMCELEESPVQMSRTWSSQIVLC